MVQDVAYIFNNGYPPFTSLQLALALKTATGRPLLPMGAFLVTCKEQIWSEVGMS